MEQIQADSLFNSFKVFKEILKGISDFTILYETRQGIYPFTTDARYFEDEPNLKSISSDGLPQIVIDTDMDDEKIAYKNWKEIGYSTAITIYIDYSAEKSIGVMNSYLNVLADYFNKKQSRILSLYRISIDGLTKSRDRDVMAEKQVVVGTITVDYHVDLDVE